MHIHKGNLRGGKNQLLQKVVSHSISFHLKEQGPETKIKIFLNPLTSRGAFLNHLSSWPHFKPVKLGLFTK